MSVLIPTSDPINGKLVPLDTGGFVRLHVRGQEITLDRLDASGSLTTADVRVSTTPEGRTTTATGALSLQDGSVGVWWVQHDTALDNDRLLFKQVGNDGTLGPVQIAATANTTAGVTYDDVRAVLLTSGQVVLSADRAAFAGAGSTTHSTFTSRVTPGQATGAALATVISRSSYSEVSTGLVALSGGGYVVSHITATDTAKYATSGEAEVPWSQIDNYGQVYDNLGHAGPTVSGGAIYDTASDFYLDQSRNVVGAVVATDDGGFAVLDGTSHLSFAYRGYFSDHYQDIGDGVTVATYDATGALRSTIDAPDVFESTIPTNSVDINGRPWSQVGTFAALGVQLVSLKNAHSAFLLIGTHDVSSGLTYAFAKAGGATLETPQDLSGSPANTAVSGIGLPDGSVVLYTTNEAGVTSRIYDVLGVELQPERVAENSTGGTLVGQITVIGRTPDQIVTLTLKGADAGAFTLSNDGKLYVASGASLDYETQRVEHLVFGLTDTTGRQIDLPLDVPVVDLNEAPTDITLSRSAFVSDRKFAAGQVLATLNAKDQDAGDVARFTLTGDAGGLFALAGDSLVVADADTLNKIAEPTRYTIGVRAEDAGSLSVDKSLALTFTDDADPKATVDVFRFDKNTPNAPVTIDVLGNDIAPTAAIDPSSVTIVAAPRLGSASVLADGSIRYTPGPNGFKNTSLTYAFKDVEGNNSTVGTLRIASKTVVPDPFVVAGVVLKDDDDKGYAEASGSFTVGRSDGTASLLRVEEGTIKAFADRLEITGTVYAAIGLGSVLTDLSKPLFRGSVTLNVDGARGPVVDSGARASEGGAAAHTDVELAGLGVLVKALQLDPNAVEVDADLSLPGSLGGAGVTSGALTGFTIGADGISFIGGVIRIRDGDVNLPVGDIKALSKGVALTYTGATDALKLQGTLELKQDTSNGFFKAPLGVKPVGDALNGRNDTRGIKLDVGDVNDPKNVNFVQVQTVAGAQKFTGRGTLSIADVRFAGGFILKEISGTFAATDTSVSLGGGLKFGIPFAPLGGSILDPVILEASFEAVVDPRIALNKIAVGISEADIAIPAIPGLFLNKVRLAADGLAKIPGTLPAQSALVLSGTVGLEYGIPAAVKIPEWLGLGSTISGRAANFDLTGRVGYSRQTGHYAIGGSGTFALFSPKLLSATIGSATGLDGTDLPLVNFSTGQVAAAAAFTLGSVFSGTGKLKGDVEGKARYVAGFGSGTFTAPKIPSFGNYAGKTLGNASLYFRYSPDDPLSLDSIGVSAQVNLGNNITTEFGFQTFFDGTTDILTGGRSLPRVGSWEVGAGQKWITMTAAWDNAAPGPVPVIVTYRADEDTPILATYTEADFAAHNIAIAEDLSGAYGRAVTVFAPLAGVWNIVVADPAGLGAVTTDAFGDAPPLTVTITNATRSAGTDPVVTVDLTVAGAANGAILDLYADTVSGAHDGVLVAGGLSLDDAAKPIVLGANDLPAGPVYLYAVVRDTQHGLTVTPDSPTPVRGADIADLAVTSVRDGVSADATSAHYTLTVTNHGPDVASVVRLALQLAGGTATVTGKSGGVDDPTQVDGVLTFAASELAAGASATIGVTVTGADGGPALDPVAAVVSAASFDPDLNDNTAGPVADGVAASTLPRLSLALDGAFSRAEGSGGATTPVAFTLTRQGDLSAASSVAIDIVGQSAGFDGDDIAGGLEPRTVLFAAGEAARTIVVDVIGDGVSEQDETFALKLSGADNAAVAAGFSTVTILNDDAAPLPSLSIVAADAQKAEGAPGAATPFTFTVERQGDVTRASGVAYTVGGSTVNAADFVGGVLPTGLISFAPGESRTTLTLAVAGDALPEDGESFAVTLASPTDATLGASTAFGFILNDDIAPAMALASVTLTGSGGLTNRAEQVVQGIAGPGDVGRIVSLYAAGIAHEVGSAVVAADGTWHVPLTLGAGTTTLSAQVANAAGDTAVSAVAAYTLADVSDATLQAVLAALPASYAVTYQAGQHDIVVPSGTDLLVVNAADDKAALDLLRPDGSGALAPSVDEATFVTVAEPLIAVAETSAFLEIVAGAVTAFAGNAPSFIVDASHDTAAVTLFAGSGRSFLLGSQGPSALFGSTDAAGSATLLGVSGATTLRGGLGADHLVGTTPGSVLIGGSGDHQVLLGFNGGAPGGQSLKAGSGAGQVLAVDAGTNVLDARGGGAGDVLWSGHGSNSLFGSDAGTSFVLGQDVGGVAQGRTDATGGTGDDVFAIQRGDAASYGRIVGGGGSDAAFFNGYQAADAMLIDDAAGGMTHVTFSTGQTVDVSGHVTMLIGDHVFVSV